MANAAAFDPDAYLAASTPAPAAGGFDPDAYLAATSAKPPAEKPGVLSRIGAAIGGALTGTAEMAGLGAPVEMFEYGVMGREPARHMPVAGPFGATAEQAREVERLAGESRKAVQQAGGVAPFVVQNVTQPFQKIGKAFTAPPQTLGEAYDVGKAVPQAAATLEMGVGGLKAVGGGIARGAEAIGQAMPKRPVAQIVKEGRAAGYSFKPSEASALSPKGTAYVGRTAEGVVGSPRLSIETAIKNQEITNKLANKDLGIAENVKLTPAKIRELKAPHNAVYKKVSNLTPGPFDQEYANGLKNIGRAPGTTFSKVKNPDIETLREQYSEKTFEPKDVVLEIRSLRRNAAKNLKNVDPKKNELGYAERQVADLLESQLERHAQNTGHPDLLNEYRNARVELAKIYNVEESLNVSTGDVSAAKISKLLKGTNYNGNLQLVRDMHDAFPSEMRDARNLRNKVPLTKLEAAIGATPAVAGMLLHNPLLAATALPVMAAPNLTRKFLLSDLYQNKLAGLPKTPKAKSPTLKDRPLKKTAKAVGRSQYLTIPITKGQQDLQEQPQ